MANGKSFYKHKFRNSPGIQTIAELENQPVIQETWYLCSNLLYDFDPYHLWTHFYKIGCTW